MNNNLSIPSNLEEVIEYFKKYFKITLDEILEMSENDFSISAHYASGTHIRNQWCLWWFENHPYEDQFPKEKPKIVEYFNNKGITHADDMRRIILTSVYRSLHNQDLKLEEQIKHYQDYWKENGYPDGIPKQDGN
ncbi:MAG: hypothetical protein E6Q38_00940 [Crocinitomicaceae bacterium]|nr:MAG: hypothetical protein E6Q38_00940 [Crocinitomicaceae bacterium]